MTIDDAIKELEAVCLLKKSDLLPFSLDAIRLGIEALEVVKDIRGHSIQLHILQMPGETEE